jgi:flavin reductase (DIM6/NTAB) family NADH-FMN oxidoreductase RutF
MSNKLESPKVSFWSTASELPQEIFAVWKKSDRALSPVAIVATVDADGAPRTAPFGSLRAVTPRLLRFCSLHDHDTYTNLRRDGRVMVALTSPDIAVSVRGRARLVKECMEVDESFAILEIDIEEVKNDMAYRIVVESGISIHAREKFKACYEAAMAELESM